MFKKYVSPTFPDLHDLAMQSALCFVNDDEFNEPARPILHKIIYIGGLGIDQPAPIIDVSIFEKILQFSHLNLFLKGERKELFWSR